METATLDWTGSKPRDARRTTIVVTHALMEKQAGYSHDRGVQAVVDKPESGSRRIAHSLLSMTRERSGFSEDKGVVCIRCK